MLAVLAAYIGSLDYNARLDSYQTKLKLNQDDLSKTAVYSYLRPTVVRPPEPLSILNQGLEGRLGTDFGISVDRENTEAEGENRGNEYLAIFSEVDLTVVVAVILGPPGLTFHVRRGLRRARGGNAQADDVLSPLPLPIAAGKIPGRLGHTHASHHLGLFTLTPRDGVCGACPFRDT